MKKTLVLAVMMACGLGALNLANAATAEGKPLPMATVLQKVQSLGYKDITEIEFENGVYKIEAVDPNQQEVELMLDAKTGDFLPADKAAAKYTMLELAKKLEGQGNTVEDIDYKSHGYYKVKMKNKNGQSVTMKFDGVTGDVRN